MREYIIYNKSDWVQGDLFGSYATDENNLVNGFKELNNYLFKNPLFSDFQNETKAEYSKIESLKGENTLRLNVNKKSSDLPVDEEYYCKSFTKLFTEGLLEEKSKVFTILFDWKSYKTQFEETGRIILKSNDGSFYELILNNRSQIKIKTFDGIKIEENLIEESGQNSIGDISSFISNDISNCYLDVQINDNKIYSRIRISAYQSKWYSSDFNSKGIDEIEFILDNRVGSNSVVNNNLNIKNIYVDGFHKGLSYKSKVFDTYENNSILKEFGIGGFFTKNAIVGYESEENIIKTEIYSSNNIEDLSDSENLTPLEIIISANDFENSNFDFTKEVQNVEGRYLKIHIHTSMSHFYQNEISFIRLNYIPGDEVKENQTQEVSEAIAHKTIGPEGGIIDTETENFNTIMYIPPGALDDHTSITIKRISSKDDIVAGDMIGFDIEPKNLEFKKPVLLEVDYAGFNFGKYQSEEGFSLAYLKDYYEPEQMSTIINKKLKKAIAYINRL